MARKPAAKKPSAKRADPHKAVIDAAMKLAAIQGWRETTLNDIASEAKVSLAEFYGLFPSKVSILKAIVRQADEEVLRGTDDFSDEPVKDRLFDLIMRRFDALAVHKDGLRAVVRDAPRDPVQAACLSCALKRSMSWMLEAAGLQSGGLSGLARIKGLSAVYLATMRVWLEDDSEDLGATMAALDKYLKRAEQFANMMSGRRRHSAAEPEAA